MKTDMVHYYYKDLETGMEMSFSKNDKWGWCVSFPLVGIIEALDYMGPVPFPELSAEEQAVVDENYKNLHRMIKEKDD